MADVKIRFTWITAHDDRTEHAVSDDAQETSRAVGAGVFKALCGVAFQAAAMDVAPARRCPRCAAVVRARNTMRDLDERMARRPRLSWLSRLRCAGARSRGRHAA